MSSNKHIIRDFEFIYLYTHVGGPPAEAEPDKLIKLLEKSKIDIAIVQMSL